MYSSVFLLLHELFLIDGGQAKIFLMLHKFIEILKNTATSSWGKLTNITFLPLKTHQIKLNP